MGVDYNTAIGLGKQIFVEYYDFNFLLWDEIIYDLEKQFPHFSFIYTSQEYKGTCCVTSIFIGKIISDADPREAKSFNITEFLQNIETKNLSPEELNDLDQVCQVIKEKFKLNSFFSNYGLNILVTAY